MRKLAPLAALALLAAACGSGKPAATAADVAPRSTTAFFTVSRVPNMRVLALATGGRKLGDLVAGTSWARFAPRAQLAAGPWGTVAYLLPKDRKSFEKALDARGLLHARVHGWEVFAQDSGALAFARHAKHPLSSAPWYAEAERAAPAHADAVLVEAGWQVISAAGDSVAVSTAGRGRGSAIASTAAIPDDAVAAFAWHDAAPRIASLPIAAQLQLGLGVPLADLAALAPGDAVFYARAGVPLPGLTLLADGGTVAAAHRVVEDLYPGGTAPYPATVDGHAVEDAAFSALDLYYGRVGRTLVVTNDPHATLVKAAHPLRPPGLPAATVGWTWVDLPRALPQLRTLASLAGATVRPSFLRRFAGLRTVLQYETAGGGVHTTTVVAS